MAGRVEIEADLCKSCELCVHACPKEILVMDKKLNSSGYHPVTVTDMDLCTGCALCALVCPDLVFEVFRD